VSVPWQPTAYTVLGFGAAVVSAAVAVRAWRHRDERGTRPFTGLMVALAGWSFAYAVQLGFTSLAGQLVWQRVSIAVGATIPTVWVVFAIEYSGRGEWLTRRSQALLALDPVLFPLVVFTNDVHRLIWTDAKLAAVGDTPVAALSLGPGYYLHIVYAYALVAVGIGVLVVYHARSSTIYRKQTALLVLGTLPPLVANVAFTLRLPWGPLPEIDPTPFAFVVTGVLFGLALFRFDLLTRTSVARQRVLDEMGDGLVVLDGNGAVVDANRIARAALDPAPTPGDSIGDIAPQTSGTDEDALDGTQVRATVDGRERVYDVDRSALTDATDDAVGEVVALRDVTDRSEYERRLEIAQRVLRHNLRNDMNAVLGWTERVERRADGVGEETRRIAGIATDLVDLSEKMQTMVRIEEEATTERRPVDVEENLKTVVASFRESDPEATIEVDVADVGTIPLPSDTFLGVPARNLVENAIEHHDAAEPWVRVSAERRPDAVEITVEDDGPEIPPMERETLAEGSEEPLQHTSGVGLWLTYRALRTVGGEVTFDTRDEGGDIVTLVYPTE